LCVGFAGQRLAGGGLNQTTPPLERQNETPPTNNNRSRGAGGVYWKALI
jgi:hypothetical protein